MRKILAATVATVAAGLAIAAPAMPKSITLIPAQCSAGTVAQAQFQRQGSQYIAGFRVVSPAATLDTWNVKVVDNGTTTILDIDVPGGNVATFVTLAKGKHTLTYRATDLTTGEVCTASASSGV